MTDTTDIKALRERLFKWREGDLKNGLDVGEVDEIADRAIDQLEAERQRTCEMTEQYLDRNAALTSATLRYEKAEAELAALRGAQEPVAVLYASGDVLTRKECADDKVFAICCKVETPLFTRQPKTVVNLNHIGRITAQISGQRYTYFSAEDIRHRFEEMKCVIVERTTPISDTVYAPQSANAKPVVVLPKNGMLSGRRKIAGVSYIELDVIISLMHTAGIVVKDGE